MSQPFELSSKTMLKRVELFRDRWSSYGAHTGIETISEKLSAAELGQFELFRDYDEKFLEKISPDVSLAVWQEGAVLFEEGAFLDLAFFIVEGRVQVSLEGVSGSAPVGALPIFDDTRTMMVPRTSLTTAEGAASPPAAEMASTEVSGTQYLRRPSGVGPSGASGNEITFLTSMDFDLPRGETAELGPGELFGEIGAMSGWPQSVTARTLEPCQLLQVRIPALRLMKRKSKALKERLDRLYRERALATQLKSTPLLRQCSDLVIEGLKESVELISCEPGETVVVQGGAVDALYLVRSGFVKLAQRFGEGGLVVSYLSKGMTLGEVELLVEGLRGWEVTATSVEYAELVKIPADMAKGLLRSSPEMEELLWKSVAARIKETGFARRDMTRSEFIQIALDSGLVQGNSMLVIDLEACTRCDDCVRACAETHGGRPRFLREGSKVMNLLVAKSCYHCRDPVCLVGCPTGAIHRAGVGAVVEIEDPVCIGCSNCANNCPYDAIVMHDTGQTWPEDTVPAGLRGQDRRVASKCDLCVDTGHGPACVSNCPQGCAYRVGSVEEIQELLRGQ